MLKRERKQEIIKEFGIKEGDTGSVEVQVALLTEEINILTSHIRDKHIHDFHSKRGLLMKVGRRRKLLDYLKKNDVVGYRNIIAKLNLRK